MLALLDAATGLAGNMLLAALLDLGLPEAEIHAPLAALGLAGAYRLELEERRSHTRTHGGATPLNDSRSHPQTDSQIRLDLPANPDRLKAPPTG